MPKPSWSEIPSTSSLPEKDSGSSKSSPMSPEYASSIMSELNLLRQEIDHTINKLDRESDENIASLSKLRAKILLLQDKLR